MAESEMPFLECIRQTAAELRKEDRAPKSLKEWDGWRERLRKHLQTAWGPFPEKPSPLEPQTLGELKRDGYRVEKIIFQTRPQVWMPANAYVPEKQGPSPAVLCVHGHWKGAKQDPHVQARCIGLVKLGFFVLAVDAFGAGERGVQTKLGEYHGDMTAATLWPAGLALSGVQVYENMRAVDYLLTRTEVDPGKIGITGASGGGNQTMYAGAWDERFKAVVPVCSVGNYQAYLGAACCMCEVVPGALRFTEEWAVLSLVAPRALMVVNATRDARQFSVEEAKKSLALASEVFALQGKEKNLRHAIFESPHDYNQPMREAMYGWMTLHLKGEGDGSPIAEPEVKTEDPEELRCWPGETRRADYMTIPRLAASECRELLKMKPLPDHLEFWESEAFSIREGLEKVLGSEPEEVELELKVTDEENGSRLLEFTSEPGVRLAARHLPGTTKRWVIVVDPEGMDAASKSEHATELQKAGWNVVCVDLRACGRTAIKSDRVGRSPDHNTAEWSLWIGRPLLGQWAWDVRRTIAAMLASIESRAEEIAVVGVQTGGLIALVAAAQEEAIDRVGVAGSLASYVIEVPYEKQRLGLMAPGIVRHAGDVPHLAALVAPRPLLVAGPIDGTGKDLPSELWEEQFSYPRRIFGIRRAGERFRVVAPLEPKAFAAKFSEI